jgi:hypothetical protein
VPGPDELGVRTGGLLGAGNFHPDFITEHSFLFRMARMVYLAPFPHRGGKKNQGSIAFVLRAESKGKVYLEDMAFWAAAGTGPHSGSDSWP